MEVGDGVKIRAGEGGDERGWVGSFKINELTRACLSGLIKPPSTRGPGVSLTKDREQAFPEEGSGGSATLDDG